MALLPADVDDLAQEGLIGLFLALEDREPPHHPFAFAKTVMRRAMGAYYPDQPPPPPVSLDILASQISPIPEEDPLQDEQILEYLEALEQSCGKIARFIVQNLLAPSDSLGRFILAELGDEVEGIRTVPVTKMRIMRAASLTKHRWFKIFREIEAFTAEFLERRS